LRRTIIQEKYQRHGSNLLAGPFSSPLPPQSVSKREFDPRPPINYGQGRPDWASESLSESDEELDPLLIKPRQTVENVSLSRETTAVASVATFYSRPKPQSPVASIYPSIEQAATLDIAIPTQRIILGHHQESLNLDAKPTSSNRASFPAPRALVDASIETHPIGETIFDIFRAERRCDELENKLYEAVRTLQKAESLRDKALASSRDHEETIRHLKGEMQTPLNVRMQYLLPPVLRAGFRE
jgi:hypothetical protein